MSTYSGNAPGIPADVGVVSINMLNHDTQHQAERFAGDNKYQKELQKIMEFDPSKVDDKSQAE